MADLVPASPVGPARTKGPAQPPIGPASPPSERPDFDDEIDLATVLNVLRRHVRLILFVAAVVTGLAGYLVFTERPVFRAQAVIRLVDSRRAITGGIEAVAVERMAGTMTDPILSQVEVMRSRGVLGEVVDREGLRLHVVSRGLDQSWIEGVEIPPHVWTDTLILRFSEDGVTVHASGEQVSAPYGRPISLRDVSFSVRGRPTVEEATVLILPREVAIDRLRENISARLRERTDVVDVSYLHYDPHMAERVLNTLVRTFQMRNASDAQQASRRRRIFVGDQLEQAEAEVRAAQDRLAAFRSRREVYSSREQLVAYQSGRLGIEVRREELEADRRMFQELLDRLETMDAWSAADLQTFIAAPGVAQNPVVVRLYEQLIEYQTARDSATTGRWSRSESHPNVQALDALIATTEARLVNAIRSHIGSLEARIRALDELEARNAAAFRELPAIEAEEMRLVQELEALQRVADLLREEFQRARIAEAVEVGQVEIVDPAVVPALPVSRGRTIKLALGLILGLMLGTGAAFLSETLNTKLRGREDVEATLGLVGLAVVPQIGGNGRGAKPIRLPMGGGNGRSPRGGPHHVETLVAATQARSPAAEAFRTLRTNLLFARAMDELRVILVTSSAPGEGKTTTAANLAVTFAQQGLKVLIIDGDLRRPRLHYVFDADREPGLSELILGYKSKDDVIQPTRVEGLSVLTTGTLPPSPAELLGSPRMRSLLHELREKYDVVIVDSPPVHVAADASVLATLADGVLLVVRSGQTEREAAQQAVRQLASVGARILGTVINDPHGKAAKYGGHYSYAYYYYGDEDES